MSHDAQSTLAHSRKSRDARRSLRRRWPVYAGVAVIALLTFAYIDGGEEPIRPIAQSVELPGGAS